MKMSNNNAVLQSDIKYASDICHLGLTMEEISNELKKIVSLEEALLYAYNPENLLWRWLPAIIYDRFELEVYLDKKWAVFGCQHSYVLIHPVFQKQSMNIHDACLTEFNITDEIAVPYTPKLAAYCYGGFPWFRSYYKLCQEHDSFEKNTTIYKVKSKKNDNQDVVTALNKFKNLYRDSFSKEISKKYPEEKYPGIIHSFHSPVHIELAIFDTFLKEML
jgi:hypothetical protein